MTSTTTTATVEPKFFRADTPKATGKARQSANTDTSALDAFTGTPDTEAAGALHTCCATAPTSVEDCPACQAWMTAHADILSGRSAELIASERTALRDAMAYAVSDGGLTPDQRDALYGTAQGDATGDPQRQYDTERDAMRRALQATRRQGAVSSVLAQVRRAQPTDGIVATANGREVLRTKAEAKAVRSAMRAWPTPDERRADLKAARAALQATAAAFAREAADNVRPDAATGGSRWAVPARQDPRTYAGPVVHTHADGTTSVYRVKVTHSGKGADRQRTEVKVPVPMGPAAALSLDAVAMVGTRWSPDATTTAADAFTGATAPRGPVVKPSTAKRRRDGRVGGPMTIGTQRRA